MMNEPEKVQLVYDPAEPTDWKVQLRELSADLNLPDEQYTKALFSNLLIDVLPQAVASDNSSELDCLINQLVEKDKNVLSFSAIVLRTSKWQVDVEGLDALARIEKAKTLLKKRGYDLYKLENMVEEEEREVKVLFQEFTRRSRLYLEPPMLSRKCAPPDPLLPSSSDQHGEPIAIPCFFPVPPLDQLARKMPRVQTLVEPAGGLPFKNVENSFMSVINRVRPVVDENVTKMLKSTLKRFAHKADKMVEDSVIQFLNDDDAEVESSEWMPQPLDLPLLPSTPRQRRPASPSMLCNPRDADVSLPDLIRTLTQNSPEQTVPQSDPIVMEDEVDLVYEGRIGLERMERWGLFCKTPDGDSGEMRAAKKFVDELDQRAKDHGHEEDEDNEDLVLDWEDKSRKMLRRLELPLIPSAREGVPSSRTGAYSKEDTDLPTSVPSLLTRLNIPPTFSTQPFSRALSPSLDPAELEKRDMEHLFGSSNGAADEVLRKLMAGDRFNERKLGMSIVRMEVPDLPPPTVPAISTLYPLLHVLPHVLGAERSFPNVLNIDLKWCPIPSDHRAYTVDTAGEFVVSEDTVRVVELAVGGVDEGEVDEEKGWDEWREWRWEWEKTYKVGDGEGRPRWMEDGTWRERKTRRRGKEVEREGGRKREMDQERDSDCETECEQGSKRGKHEQQSKRWCVKECGNGGKRSSWTDRRHHSKVRHRHQQTDKDHSHGPATSMTKRSKDGNDGVSGASKASSARRLGRRVSSGVKRMDAWLERLAESEQENDSSSGDGKRRRLEEGADDAVDEIEIQRRTRVERWAEELAQENPVIIIEDEDEDEGEGADNSVESVPSHIVPRITVSRENSDVRGRPVNDGPGYDKLPQAYEDDKNLPFDDHALYSPRMGVDMLLGREKVDLEHMENIQVDDDTHVIGGKETTKGFVVKPSTRAEDDKQSTYYGDEEYDAILDAALISMSEQELLTNRGKKAVGGDPISSRQAWEAGFAADNGGDRNDVVPMLRWRGPPPLILPVFEPGSKEMKGLQQQPPQQQKQQQQQQNYHYQQQQQQQQNYQQQQQQNYQQQQQQQQNYHNQQQQQKYHHHQQQKQQLPSHVTPGALDAPPLSSLPKQLFSARSNPFYHTTPHPASPLPIPASPVPAPKKLNMFDAFSARQSVDRFLAFRGMVKGVSRRDEGGGNVRDDGKDADSIPYCELTAPLSIPPTIAAVDSEVPTVIQGKSKYFTHAGSEAVPGANVGKSVYRGDFVPASKLRKGLK